MQRFPFLIGTLYHQPKTVKQEGGGVKGEKSQYKISPKKMVKKKACLKRIRAGGGGGVVECQGFGEKTKRVVRGKSGLVK